jgi:hypothetical protein
VQQTGPSFLLLLLLFAIPQVVGQECSCQVQELIWNESHISCVDLSNHPDQPSPEGLRIAHRARTQRLADMPICWVQPPNVSKPIREIDVRCAVASRIFVKQGIRGMCGLYFSQGIAVTSRTSLDHWLRGVGIGGEMWHVYVYPIRIIVTIS